MKSNCCLSTLITRSSDEGTSYYECKACGEPCDVAPQNQPPLDTGHHAEYDYKKNQTKGEVCGCEADEQGIEHTTDAHTPSKPVGEWEEEMKTYLTSAGDRRRVIDFIKTRFISKTEHEKKIREAERELIKDIENKMKPALDDWTKAGKTLIKNRFENTGNEMIENVGYIKGIFSQLKGEKK